MHQGAWQCCNGLGTQADKRHEYCGNAMAMAAHTLTIHAIPMLQGSKAAHTQTQTHTHQRCGHTEATCDNKAHNTKCSGCPTALLHCPLRTGKHVDWLAMQLAEADAHQSPQASMPSQGKAWNAPPAGANRRCHSTPTTTKHIGHSIRHITRNNQEATSHCA